MSLSNGNSQCPSQHLYSEQEGLVVIQNGLVLLYFSSRGPCMRLILQGWTRLHQETRIKVFANPQHTRKHQRATRFSMAFSEDRLTASAMKISWRKMYRLIQSRWMRVFIASRKVACVDEECWQLSTEMIRHISQENNNDFVRLLTFLADPIVPCCDLCDPTLLDRTRPAPKVNQPKAMTMKTGIVNKTVRSALQRWRSRIWQRDFKDALFAPSGILSDECIDNLSSVGPIGRLNELERVVGMDWPWFGQYGDTLLEELEKLNIPPMQPKQQKKAEKRTVSELEDEQTQPALKIVPRTQMCDSRHSKCEVCGWGFDNFSPVQFLVKFLYSINLFQSIPNVTKGTIKLCWKKGFVERIWVFRLSPESKREISLSQRHARGVPLKMRSLLPVLRWWSSFSHSAICLPQQQYHNKS